MNLEKAKMITHCAFNELKKINKIKTTTIPTVKKTRHFFSRDTTEVGEGYEKTLIRS